MRIDAQGVPDAEMAEYLDRIAWSARRREDETPHALVNKLRVAATRSGNAVLAALTDSEAYALVPGDYVLIASAASLPAMPTLQPVRVLGVRTATWEMDKEPEEVPVIDVELPNGKKTTRAVDDVVVVQLLSGVTLERYIAAHAA